MIKIESKYLFVLFGRIKTLKFHIKGDDMETYKCRGFDIEFTTTKGVPVHQVIFLHFE